MDTKTIQKTNTNENDKIFAEMMQAGIHYGRAKRFTHPSMRPFLLKSNKNIELFNLKITLQKLDEVVDFMKSVLSQNKRILFVGITPASANEIEKLAKSLNQFYLNFKWIGGFLTNFTTLQSRLVYFRDLLKKEENGELENYSPMEKSRIERELQKLKNVYRGVIDLSSLPDVVFIVNLAFNQHKTALRESLKMKIPVISLSGSDNDISKVFLFVPGNDKAPKSISWQINYILNKINKSE